MRRRQNDGVGGPTPEGPRAAMLYIYIYTYVCVRRRQNDGVGRPTPEGPRAARLYIYIYMYICFCFFVFCFVVFCFVQHKPSRVDVSSGVHRTVFVGLRLLYRRADLAQLPIVYCTWHQCTNRNETSDETSSTGTVWLMLICKCERAMPSL